MIATCIYVRLQERLSGLPLVLQAPQGTKAEEKAGKIVVPMPELQQNSMLIAGKDGKLQPEDGRHQSPNEVG